jgi:GNAT superfamily N-acetyltransferase
MPEAIDITHLVAVSLEREVLVRLHLLRADNKDQIAELIKPCVESAYAKEDFTAELLKAGYFVLTITKQDVVIATLTAYWLPCPANAFETRFEAVHKDYQRKGYGAMLFQAMDVAALFLAKQDPYIAINLGGYTTLAIHAYVDVKKKTHPTFWHTDMMLKLDYEEIEIVRKERLMEKIIEL